jgi:hypothetical protein
MRRRRIRKWAKWACTVAAVLAVGVAVVSRFRGVAYLIADSADTNCLIVGFGEGLVGFTFRGPAPADRPPGPSSWLIGPSERWLWGLSRDLPALAPAGHGGAGVLWWNTASERGFLVSVLHPALVTSIPAALLWYADRRRLRPGACGGCGYDRAGIAPDTACPECGKVPTK